MAQTETIDLKIDKVINSEKVVTINDKYVISKKNNPDAANWKVGDTKKVDVTGDAGEGKNWIQPAREKPQGGGFKGKGSYTPQFNAKHEALKLAVTLAAAAGVNDEATIIESAKKFEAWMNAERV